ncbi:MAG: heavy metal transporter [Flavobacterium sp. BFFFF1]|uniref:heavy-metal-associated domain-containing protein n=1 Tax=unclassified Flavobacterium TaxID=196869 RepID=UPI000BC8D455|nr:MULTISPECIES: heavy metal-associated domain-containing protein [unclassified Flavobacterium]OYU79631.1 MAG: heavy metal transporter [Flavobacterium sp. BFFFF1]
MHQIEVENLKCGGCANSIEKALLKLQKVESVKVNVDNNIIVIVGDADRQQIVEKLAEIGYPEKGNNTVFCKAKSYLSCAIGKLN